MRSSHRPLFAFLLMGIMFSVTLTPANASTIQVGRTIFNTAKYTIGSTGNATVILGFLDNGASVGLVGIYLLFMTSNGSMISQFVGQSYKDSPMYVAPNLVVAFTYPFQVPNVIDLVSGNFYYITVVSYREEGKASYTNSTFGPYAASSSDRYCFLENPAHPSYMAFEYIMNSYKMNYTDLKNNYTSLSNKYSSLKQEYDSLNKTYSALNQDYTAIVKEYAGLQKDFNSIAETVGAFRNQLNSLQLLLAAITVTLISTLIGTIIFFTRKFAILRREKTVDAKHEPSSPEGSMTH